MTRGDLVFVDTNVLLSATDRSREDHTVCKNLIESAVASGIHLVASGQVFREYLVVATRPVAGNGLGLPPSDAVANVRTFQSYVHLLPEQEEVSHMLAKIVDATEIRGKRIHDANIAATMRVHRVTVVATANTSDYADLPEVHPLTPTETFQEIRALMEPPPP